MREKKYFSLFGLYLVFIQLSAQNYDYAFEYFYYNQIDSTDINSLEVEPMLLLYNNQKSHFLGKTKFQIDTLRINQGDDLQKIMALKSTLPKNRAKFEIIKNFTDNSANEYYELIYINYYKSRYIQDMKYELVDEDTIILGYNCKKARTSLSGRNYILWYTSEIPISDGPYKFSGLPGLVMEVYDDKKQHTFKIIKIENKQLYYKPEFKNLVNANMQEIAKVRKEQLELVKNSGISISTETMAMLKEKLKGYNNPIELTDE